MEPKLYDDSMDDLAYYVFLMQVIQVQKRYMQHCMYKPPTLKMKEYMAWAKELNNYLKIFPGYHDGIELQDDELLDIYEFGVATSWQKQFLVQNWDPIQHSKQEFHEFYE
jgi:hypothetical protein